MVPMLSENTVLTVLDNVIYNAKVSADDDSARIYTTGTVTVVSQDMVCITLTTISF